MPFRFTIRHLSKLTAVKFGKKSIVSLLLILSNITYAMHGVVTLSGGPGWYQAGQTQSLYLQPDFLNTYVAQKETRQLTDIELFLGVQHTFYQHYQTQLGVSGAVFSAAKVTGNVWELGDPLFNNFTHQYRINHSHIALQGKLLSDVIHPAYLPYVSVSLGAARNKASAFSSTPLIFEVLTQPSFASNSQTSFTYTLGIGLVRVLGQHWQAGLGYAFTDEGKSTLGPSSVQTTSSRLTLNHLFVNTLQCSLSYLS